MLRKGLDPMEQIALVVKDQSIVGWLGFDMLDTESNLNDCIEVLKPNQIISSETNLITLVDIFHKSTNPFFFVLRNNNIIGWISYIDLHGAPLGICLLAQILEIEKTCLNLCLLNPENNFKLLSTQQRNNAMSNYLKNNYSLNKDGKPYFAKTMELLPLKVKLYVLQKLFPANDIFYKS
ncbi:MAG: hypothetical protein IPP06_05315 [Saprospiraceae bacterium]|nr:hypothetical protein [Candidatus Vicinibacter affinis]